MFYQNLLRIFNVVDFDNTTKNRNIDWLILFV